jgi:hypothetical protein
MVLPQYLTYSQRSTCLFGEHGRSEQLKAFSEERERGLDVAMAQVICAPEWREFSQRLMNSLSWRRWRWKSVTMYGTSSTGVCC